VKKLGCIPTKGTETYHDILFETHITLSARLLLIKRDHREGRVVIKETLGFIFAITPYIVFARLI